jgi:tripartite-type tricarboxylate transporter receptor subunit TctC
MTRFCHWPRKPACLGAFVAALCATGAALADWPTMPEHAAQNEAVAFYTGRRMTMISGYTPEGGDRQQERAFAGMTITSGLKPRGEEDLHGRLLARHIGRHIPGRPTFIVQTMPGAGGRRAADYLYNRAPRDGSVIGNLERGLAAEPLLQGGGRANADGARIAPAFEWIGSLGGETGFVIAWGAPQNRDIQSLFEYEMIVGGTTPDHDSIRLARALNALLGTRFRIIGGYTGTIELQIAMERGEIAGFLAGSSDIKSRLIPWVQSGQARALLQLGLQQDLALPDVPLALGFARTTEDRDALAFIFAGQALGLPYAAPPGTPAERVTALRRAFDDTVRDGDFLADAARLELIIQPLSGGTVAALLDRLASTPARIRVHAADAVLQRPGKNID